MKSIYIVLPIIAIFAYNGAMAKRDQKMFDAYNRACSQLPQPHPDCRYAEH
jgi:hypothetical protein